MNPEKVFITMKLIREELSRIEKSDKAFSLMDRNRDNSIDPDFWPQNTNTKYKIQNTNTQIDQGGDFIKMKLIREEMSRIEKSDKAFSLMDRNRDNSISVDEFVKVTQIFGPTEIVTTSLSR